MVLVFAEHQKGAFKKSAFEAVTYGAKTAAVLGAECVALVLGNAENAGQLGTYGASKVYQVTSDHLAQFDSQVYTATIAAAAEQLGASTVVLSHSSTGKSLVGRLAVKLGAGSVAGVNAVPTNDGSFRVSKGVFSGKAFATYEIKSDKKVLSLMGNAVPVEETGAAVEVESLSVEVPAPKVKVKEVKRAEGTVPLPEAELVV
ncbi:MAG: electron transfer flavoprotein subunit alpha/FixB family protein, partial [Bacteroidota bacterium]